MTGREKLKLIYELAFYPPRLNEVWRRVRRNGVEHPDELGELLDAALLLHGALPSSGYSSQRALNRLALRQAKARAFHTVHFLKNLRRALGRSPLSLAEVPGNLVRDIAIPPLARSRAAHVTVFKPAPGRRGLLAGSPLPPADIAAGSSNIQQPTGISKARGASLGVSCQTPA